MTNSINKRSHKLKRIVCLLFIDILIATGSTLERSFSFPLINPKLESNIRRRNTNNTVHVNLIILNLTFFVRLQPQIEELRYVLESWNVILPGPEIWMVRLF
jgi:hypothetical protein